MRVDTVSSRRLHSPILQPTARSVTPVANLSAPMPSSPVDRVHLGATGAPRRLLDQAGALARSTLEGNMWKVRIKDDPRDRTVILAGLGKFDALWTRDAMYASMGALAIGHHQAVRETLMTLLDHQFADGLIPRRIGKDSTEWNAVLNAIGIHRPRQSHFDTVDRGNASFWTGSADLIPPDSNMLVVQMVAEYVKKTGDRAFLATYYPKLEKAMAWLATQVEDGLITQVPFSDWKDTANRGRVTMYNQVLYFRALRSMAELAGRQGDRAGAAHYRAQAEALAGRIRAFFWDEQNGFFKDSESAPGFSPDGNLLAVAYGLTTPTETSRIFSHIDELLRQRSLLPATEIPYPPEKIPLVLRLFGMQHYHDSQAWPWQESLYAIAAARVGDKARAERALASAAALAVRDRGFFEVYEGEPPQPVHKLFYKSEPNFSWSAGLFLRAKAELYGQ